MCGCGAGETGGNRFCGGSQLRRSGSTEGGRPLCGWVQGRQRTAGVKGVRVASGDLCSKAAKAPTEAEARDQSPLAG